MRASTDYQSQAARHTKYPRAACAGGGIQRGQKTGEGTRKLGMKQWLQGRSGSYMRASTDYQSQTARHTDYLSAACAGGGIQREEKIDEGTRKLGRRGGGTPRRIPPGSPPGSFGGGATPSSRYASENPERSLEAKLDPRCLSPVLLSLCVLLRTGSV